jgi:hypothetical protein
MDGSKLMANPPINYNGRESEEPQIWTPRGKRKSAGDSLVHIPCGHWHKAGAPGTVGCLRYEAELNAAPFNNTGPRSMTRGSDGFLYSFQSWSSSPVLKRINIETLAVVASKIFTPTELVGVSGFTTAQIYDLQEFEGALYAVVMGATPTGDPWIVKLSITTLEVLDRWFLGDTAVGTDGKNYFCKAPNVRSSATQPITGVFGLLVWQELPAGYAHNVDAWYSGGTSKTSWGYSPIYTHDYIYVATVGTTTSNISKYDWNGLLIATSVGQRIQIANLAINPAGTKIAVLYGKTGYTYDPFYIDILDISDMSLLVNAVQIGTWNAGSQEQDSTVVFHSNGYIYCAWMEDNTLPDRQLKAGVAKIDWNGNVEKTYDPGYDTGIRGALVFASDYLFWWQGGLGDPVVGGIVKLDLDLTVICIEPFHFVAVTQGFQETAISQLAIASDTERRNFIWLGQAGHYTKWYYY